MPFAVSHAQEALAALSGPDDFIDPGADGAWWAITRFQNFGKSPCPRVRGS